MHIVYMVRNKVNGHRYIGVTRHSLARRQAQEVYTANRGSDQPVSRAIRDFGIEAMLWFPVAEVKTIEQALRLEHELTLLLRPEYNIVFGGGGRRAHIRPVRSATTPSKAASVRTVLLLPEIEEWRAVPGYEGYYEVSSHGRVKSLDRIQPFGARGHPRLRRGRILRPNLNRRDSRLSVNLALEKRLKTFRLATLVAFAFLGQRPAGLEVCHLSDDKNDNKISNIYYGTHQQNCDDRTRNGKTMQGSKATGAKLSEDQAREIKILLSETGRHTHESIARRFGVNREIVSAIARGKTWRHIGAEDVCS